MFDPNTTNIPYSPEILPRLRELREIRETTGFEHALDEREFRMLVYSLTNHLLRR